MLLFVLFMIGSAMLFVTLVGCFRNRVEEFYDKSEVILYVLLTLAIYLLYCIFVVLTDAMGITKQYLCFPLVNTGVLFLLIWLANILFAWRALKKQLGKREIEERKFINGFLMVGTSVLFGLFGFITNNALAINLSVTFFVMFLGFFVSLGSLVNPEHQRLKGEWLDNIGRAIKSNVKESVVCLLTLVLCVIIITFSDVVNYALYGSFAGVLVGVVISWIRLSGKKATSKKGKKKREMKSFSRITKGMKIAITCISFLGAIFFKSEIDFSNLKSINFDYSIAKDFMADICIGIFSAMILVWLIDEVKENGEKKEESKKHKILYRKLVPFLQNYYEFYLNLYITTRKDAVPSDWKVLHSVAACKEELISQIREADPFYKPGFYGDPRKFEWQVNAMQQAKEEELKEIMEMDTSLPLYHCWTIDSGKFVNGVEEIERKFLDFFPGDLLDKVDRLLDTARCVKNMREWIDGVGDFQGILGHFHQGPLVLPVEFFIEDAKLIETLELLENVIEYVEEEIGEDIRNRNAEFFNNRNTKPILGDSYK